MAAHGYNILRTDDYPHGLRYLRLWDIGVTWANVNPAPDVYDWTRLDQTLEIARTNGTANFLYVLGMTPQWAARNPNTTHHAPWIGPGSSSPPFDMKLWEKYVWNVATRYKGRIQFYQVWNEPQLKEFWDDYSTIHILATMTKRAKSIINRIDPAAKIVAAPVLPRPTSGGMLRARRYLTALKSDGWPVDIYACHIYPEKDLGPARWRDLAKHVQGSLTAIQAPRKPLWVTETNYNLMGGPLPDSKIPAYIEKTNEHAENLGIRRIYWYGYGVHSNPQLFGIPFTRDSIGTQTLTRYL